MSEACFFNASRFLRSRPACLLLLLCAEIHTCQNVKKHDPYGRIRSRHLRDEHDFPKRHVLGVSTEMTVSRACEAETSGWECRTQRRAGWAGLEEQREGGERHGGKEGKAEGWRRSIRLQCTFRSEAMSPKHRSGGSARELSPPAAAALQLTLKMSFKKD